MVGLAFAGVANASVQQGDTELDFLGGFVTQNGEKGNPDFDVWFVSGALGYFFTDNIEGQVAALGIWTSTDFGGDVGNFDVDVYGLGVAGKYYFMPTNQWVPYVGGQLLWVDADIDVVGDMDGTLWGPVAGLRYELNAYNDFFVEYQYHIWNGDVGDILDDGHGLFAGIIHQFK